MGDASFFSPSKPVITPRQRHGTSGDVFRMQPSPGPRMRLSFPTTPVRATYSTKYSESHF